MIEIMLTGTEIKIGVRADGQKALVVEDKQSGIRILLAMDEASARAVAAALVNGLVIANKMPPEKIMQ